MTELNPPPSCNRHIKDLKETARAATARAERADFEREKAEAALRSMHRELTAAHVRANRAEAILRSHGLRGAA